MTHGTLDAVKFIAAGENVALTTKGTKIFRASAAFLHFSTLVVSQTSQYPIASKQMLHIV
jgi:hypothetical protein